MSWGAPESGSVHCLCGRGASGRGVHGATAWRLSVTIAEQAACRRAWCRRGDPRKMPGRASAGPRAHKNEPGQRSAHHTGGGEGRAGERGCGGCGSGRSAPAASAVAPLRAAPFSSLARAAGLQLSSRAQPNTWLRTARYLCPVNCTRLAAVQAARSLQSQDADTPACLGSPEAQPAKPQSLSSTLPGSGPGGKAPGRLCKRRADCLAAAGEAAVTLGTGAALPVQRADTAAPSRHRSQDRRHCLNLTHIWYRTLRR